MHAAVAENELSSAGVQTVKAFALDDIGCRGRWIQALVPVSHQCQSTTCGARYRFPMPIHGWIPGKVIVGNLPHHNGIGRSIGNVTKAVGRVAPQYTIEPVGAGWRSQLAFELRIKAIGK